MSFTNLIRFEDQSGVVRYGNVLEANLGHITGSEVQILEGDPFADCMQLTPDTAVVHKVCVAFAHTEALYNWPTKDGSPMNRFFHRLKTFR
jgi:hypothetical protein